MCVDFDLNRIFFQIAGLIRANSAAPADGEAQSLMEYAAARAGSHSYQAVDLRNATSACLSPSR